MCRGAKLYPVLGLAAAMLYLPLVGGYFIADDWMVLARNLDVPWRQVPSWFLAVRHDWYRPLFELLVAASWRQFGLHSIAYHLLCLVLFALAVMLVGLLGECLSGDRRIGLLATVLFALQGFHAEPVLWFAASSDLLVALFVLGSLAAYIRFRQTGRRRWLMVAVVAFLLALASKETAVVLPLAWLAYEALFGRCAEDGRGRRWWPSVVALAVAVLFFAWRLVAGGNPYPVRPTAGLLIRNLGHYFTLQVLAMPIDFDYTAPVSLWQAPRLLAVVTTLAALLALAIVGWLWLRWRLWRPDAAFDLGYGRRWRTFAFAVAFALLALGPVLPIVAERTAFLSSAGVAWGLACLFVAAADGAVGRAPGTTDAVIVALALYVAAQATVLVYRASMWGQAGEISRTVFDQLDRELPALPPQTPVTLWALPDNVAYAYVFRNTFPYAGQVLGWRQPATAVLDTDVAKVTRILSRTRDVPSARPPGANYWYNNRLLTRVQR
jgi:hypothetical protein